MAMTELPLATFLILLGSAEVLTGSASRILMPMVVLGWPRED